MRYILALLALLLGLVAVLGQLPVLVEANDTAPIVLDINASHDSETVIDGGAQTIAHVHAPRSTPTSTPHDFHTPQDILPFDHMLVYSAQLDQADAERQSRRWEDLELEIRLWFQDREDAKQERLRDREEARKRRLQDREEERKQRLRDREEERQERRKDRQYYRKNSRFVRVMTSLNSVTIFLATLAFCIYYVWDKKRDAHFESFHSRLEAHISMTEQENSLRGPVSLLPVASPFPSNIHDGHCQTIPLRAPESLPPVASPSTSHTVDSQPQHIDADQETSVISPGPLSPSTSPSISDIVDGPLQRIDIDQEPRLRESGSVLLSASPFPSNIVEDPRQPHLELTDIYQEPCLRVPGPLSLITSRFTTNAVKDNTQLQRIDLGQETRLCSPEPFPRIASPFTSNIGEDCSQPQRTDIDRETLLQSPGPFSSIASGSAPSLNTGDGHTHTQCADYNDLIAMLSTPLLLASSMASVSSLGAVDEWARYIVASSTNLNMVEQAFPLVPEATSLQEALEAVFRPDAFADREQRVWAFAPRLIAVDPWAVDLLSKRGQVVPILRTSGSITQFFPELGDHD